MIKQSKKSSASPFLCAVGVVPTRVYPKSGRISALAGREGRLRACTENFQQGYNPRRYWSRKNLGFRLEPLDLSSQ